MSAAIDPTVVATLEQIRARTGRDVLGRAAGLFAAEAPKHLAALDSALAAGDAGAVAAAAHGLKSMCGNIGAHHAAACCDSIEAEGRNGALTAAAGLAAGLPALVDDALAELGAYTAR